MVFSGGQDSTTCLVQAQARYDEVHAITFDYGQRHRAEIDTARHLATALGIAAHKVMDVTMFGELAISALTRDDIPVSFELQENGLPNTFVPGRNILFLTLAAIYAYQVGAEAVITGVCETDFSGYPDCRDDFVKALNQAVSLGLDRPIRFETPDVARQGRNLGAGGSLRSPRYRASPDAHLLQRDPGRWLRGLSGLRAASPWPGSLSG